MSTVLNIANKNLKMSKVLLSLDLDLDSQILRLANLIFVLFYLDDKMLPIYIVLKT